MKAKWKSPEIAKDMGLDFNKKLLKKLVSEPFAEPQRFFYDSQFDYGAAGAMPMLYIGDVPTMWKKYIKEHKKEKTFAAGICMLDADGNIKLEVQAGKGGKAMVLKEINKELLKPFSKAYFVESISSGVEIGDAAESEGSEADGEEESNDDEILAELNDFIKEANTFKTNLSEAARLAGNEIKDIRNIVVTSALIKNVDKAVMIIEANRTNAFLAEAAAFVSNVPADAMAKNAALAKAVADLKKLLTELTPLAADAKLILKNSVKLKMVEDPSESEFPPISDDPFDNFGSVLKGLSKKTALNKHTDSLKSF